MSIPPSVAHVSRLAGMPRELVHSRYGGKAAGYVELPNLQAQLPGKFTVPPAFAISPKSVAGIDEPALRQAFGELTAGLKPPRVLLARSSHLQERPGEKPTLPVLYKRPWFPWPGWTERTNFKRFARTVDQMQADDPDLGILATVMEGGLRHYLNHGKLIGAELVSFVANTHDPTKPSQMTMTFVQGLGTQAVDANANSVIVKVDRATGGITFFGCKSEVFLSNSKGSVQPATAETYRQRNIDAYDPRNGAVVTLQMDPFFLGELAMGLDRSSLLPGEDFAVKGMVVVEGALQLADAEAFVAMNPLSTMYMAVNDMILGVTPFDNPAMLTALVDILQEIALLKGPSQIEGAFPMRSDPVPALYQYLALPELPREARPLKPLAPHLHSTAAMGSGTFEGPLIYFDPCGRTPFMEQLAKLGELNSEYAETGYILVTTYHDGHIMLSTPHCRVRLARYKENLSSHSVTLMQYRIAENPGAGFMYAMKVEVTDKDVRHIGGKTPTILDPDYAVYAKARVDSNGEELVVEVL